MPESLDPKNLSENQDPSEQSVLFHPAKNLSAVFKDVLSEHPEESFYFLNEEVLRKRVEMFQEYFLPEDSRREIAYAVKANPLPKILEIISEEGISTFDCSSIEEILKIQKLDPEAAILFNNPHKKLKNIEASSKKGVTQFTADIKSEVDKILRA